MGNRISIKAWGFFNNEYPHDVAKMQIVEIDLDSFSIPSRFYAYKRKGISKNNVERYGDKLGNMLDWMDENANYQYYADINRGRRGVRSSCIKFYFFDDTDALAFKLMFI